MSRKALQADQEKVLYLLKLLGPNETLDILETELKKRCNIRYDSKVVPITRIK